MTQRREHGKGKKKEEARLNKRIKRRERKECEEEQGSREKISDLKIKKMYVNKIVKVR